MAVTTVLYSSTVQTNYSDTISFAFLLCCGNDCFLYTPVKHHIEKQTFKPQSSIFFGWFSLPFSWEQCSRFKGISQGEYLARLSFLPCMSSCSSLDQAHYQVLQRQDADTKLFVCLSLSREAFKNKAGTWSVFSGKKVPCKGSYISLSIPMSPREFLSQSN